MKHSTRGLLIVILCSAITLLTAPGGAAAKTNPPAEPKPTCKAPKIILIDRGENNATFSVSAADDKQKGKYTITARYMPSGDIVLFPADTQQIDKYGKVFYFPVNGEALAGSDEKIIVEYKRPGATCAGEKKGYTELSLYTKHTLRFDFGAVMDLDSKGAFNNKPQLAFSSRSLMHPTIIFWSMNMLAGFDIRYIYYSEGTGGTPSPGGATDPTPTGRLGFDAQNATDSTSPAPPDSLNQSGGRFEFSWFIAPTFGSDDYAIPLGMNFVSEPDKTDGNGVQSVSNWFAAFRFRVDRYGSLGGISMKNANAWVQGGYKFGNIQWDKPWEMTAEKVFLEAEMDAYGGESSKLRLRLLAEVPINDTKDNSCDCPTNDTRVMVSFLWSFDPLASGMFPR
ncbi:MAG: hypothetical protein OEZ04_09180 [Nitrospinota bacterium]|nr:hypothetical protein [Nitrospinota bacterium]